MARLLSPRRLVPIAVSAVIVALALRFLSSATHGLHVADVLRALHQIPLTAVAIGATLVVVLYTALGTYEAIIARYVGGPVSRRRAAMGGVLAASIGHALGLGTVSGGAIRYRVYSAAGLRPLDLELRQPSGQASELEAGRCRLRHWQETGRILRAGQAGHRYRRQYRNFHYLCFD